MSHFNKIILNKGKVIVCLIGLTVTLALYQNFVIVSPIPAMPQFPRVLSFPIMPSAPKVTQDIFTGTYFGEFTPSGSVPLLASPFGFGDNILNYKQSVELKAKLSSGIVQVKANFHNFAALYSNGSVVTFGDSTFSLVDGFSLVGPGYKIYPNTYSGVVSIYSHPSGSAFAAIKSNGSVVTWGNKALGGDSQAVSSQISSGVVYVFSTAYSFAALKSNGSVVTWGDAAYGGDSGVVKSKLSSGVVRVYASAGAFAALKSDGSVVTWGSAAYGGNTDSTLRDAKDIDSKLLSGVIGVYANDRAFAALRSDGSVVTWGDANSAGTGYAYKETSFGVVRVVPKPYGFLLTKANGYLLTLKSVHCYFDTSNYCHRL